MPKIAIKAETLAQIIKAKEMISEAQSILENLTGDLREQELDDVEGTIDDVIDELGTQWDNLEELVTELQNPQEDEEGEETETYTVKMWNDGSPTAKFEEIKATSPEHAEEIAEDEFPGLDNYTVIEG